MTGDSVEVIYSEERWKLLREKRGKAIEIIEALSHTIPPGLVVVHGSVARGDVEEDSDVDVAVLEPLPPSLVEFALARRGLKPVVKLIVQATPSNTPKAYLILDYKEERVVSLPLAPLKPREREFYRWGGELDYEGLKKGARVPGVDKRLYLIKPTDRGHVEMPVKGNEGLVARTLGISLDTVAERVRVLTRRREHGRTGVFLKEEVPPETPIEEAVREVSVRNPIFRRALRGWV